MPIAFDAAHNGDTTGNANSLTYSHVTSGSDRILFVFAHTYVAGAGSTGDIITGITYNGTAMAFVDKQLNAGGVYNRYQYCYVLVNPTVGTNNVVISASSALFRLLASSASYTGAQQTGQPDAFNKKTTDAITSQELSTTTVANNSWVVSGADASLDTIVVGAGLTARAGANTFTTRLGDSNGPKTPAGAYSATWTTSISSPFNVIQASFSPVPDTTGGAFLTNFI